MTNVKVCVTSRRLRWQPAERQAENIEQPLHGSRDSFTCAVHFQLSLKKVVHHTTFEVISALVIVANAAYIGYDLHTGKEMSWLGDAFVVFFSIELLMRCAAGGIKVVKDKLVLFDTFIVSISLICHPLIASWMKIGSSNLESLNIFRMARLLRLGRTGILLFRVPTLYTLVRGLIESVSTMLYTLLLLCCILYIFSCIGYQILSQHHLAGPNGDAEFRHHVDLYFSSLPKTMLTLVQFVSMDSASSIYQPLVEKDALLFAYFASIILVVPVVLMNLVTAVVVQSSLDAAMKNRAALMYRAEIEKKGKLTEMRALFERLDKDKSGIITIDEMSRFKLNSTESHELCFLQVLLILWIFLRPWILTTVELLQLMNSLMVFGT